MRPRDTGLARQAIAEVRADVDIRSQGLERGLFIVGMMIAIIMRGVTWPAPR